MVQAAENNVLHTCVGRDLCKGVHTFIIFASLFLFCYVDQLFFYRDAIEPGMNSRIGTKKSYCNMESVLQISIFVNIKPAEYEHCS